MRMRGAAAGALLALWVGSATAEPFLPAGDAEVLEVLPLAGSTALAGARDLSRELDLTPTDDELAVATARAWLALGRAEGDPRYVGRAQAALAPWVGDAGAPVDVLLARSAVLRAQHDFPAALKLLDLAIAAAPDHPQVLLDRAAVLENLGDPQAALRACADVARQIGGLVAASCSASAESLSGSAPGAYAALTAALADAPSEDPGVRGWATTVLGDIAALLGERGSALRHYRAAAALAGPDIYLLAAQADLLLDAGREAEVLELTEGQERHDGLLLRRILALRAVRPAEVEPDRREFARRMAAQHRRGDDSHLRDAARFTLLVEGRADEALTLARRNWQRQRAIADARVFLEAALAAGDAGAARPVLEWMVATRIEDITLLALAQRLAGAS